MTLEAELRQAPQHQRAAIEQARETQIQLERMIARAIKLLDSQCGSVGPHSALGARKRPADPRETIARSADTSWPVVNPYLRRVRTACIRVRSGCLW